jgi:adenosylcobinamide kinase / adenosylcobinamide-phosphate guanylyltransferase
VAPVTLITGGARSGKSSHAIASAIAYPATGRRIFIATAEALDGEMRARISHHRATRPAEFETLEAPLELVAALSSVEARAEVVVIDCLTLWIANLMGAGLDDDAIEARARALAAALIQLRCATFVVSGEVGDGVVPVEATARRFRDRLGWTNQIVARAANNVLLMVAGYPIRVK